MVRLLLTTFVAVFLAEVVGDKLLYTTGALAARYRSAPVLAGMTAALMVKMGAAVALGRSLSLLPPMLLAVITGTSLLGVAFVLWRRPTTAPSEKAGSGRGGTALVSFAAVLSSEWADAGQLTAATLAAQSGAPVAVWLGASSAVITKGALATSLGVALRRWIAERVPPGVLRYASVGIILLVGALSVLESLSRRPM